MFDVFRSSLDELNPISQVSKTKSVGLLNLGILIMFAFMVFGLREFGTVTWKQTLQTVAGLSIVGGLVVEGLNMVDNFAIRYLSFSAMVHRGSGNARRAKFYSLGQFAERVAVTVIGLGFVAGLAVWPVLNQFMGNYSLTAPLIAFLAWLYIVIPGRPVFGLPFGFVAIQMLSIVACIILGIPVNISII